MVRDRHGERRPRREARRGRRRWVPALLRRRSKGFARRRWRARGSPKSGSASSSRGRPCSSATDDEVDRLQCVILAGGRGERMRPMTDSLPKTLIPVGGVPFADHQLDWLARNGVESVVYCIGYRGDLDSRVRRQRRAMGRIGRLRRRGRRAARDGRRAAPRTRRGRPARAILRPLRRLLSADRARPGLEGVRRRPACPR